MKIETHVDAAVDEERDFNASHRSSSSLYSVSMAVWHGEGEGGAITETGDVVRLIVCSVAPLVGVRSPSLEAWSLA